jgi:hypothetical protein
MQDGSLESKMQDTGAGCRMQGVECTVGCKMQQQDEGRRTQDVGCWIREAGAGSRGQDAECRVQDTCKIFRKNFCRLLSSPQTGSE